MLAILFPLFTRQSGFVALSLLARAIFAQSSVSTPQSAEASVTKSAEIPTGGHTLRYVASAGTIPIGNADGEIAAKMFYVAYTVEAGPNAAPRPVTFAFNGGPGSSSSPLLLAAIGPLRVNLDLPQPTSVTQAAAVTLSPNDATILDRTDLVFLDAVGTGYSHAVGKASDHDFWGVDEDIESFSKAIPAGWARTTDGPQKLRSLVNRMQERAPPDLLHCCRVQVSSCAASCL